MQRVLRCSGMVIEVSVDSEEAQKETGASAEEDAGDPVLRQWLKSYVGTGEWMKLEKKEPEKGSDANEPGSVTAQLGSDSWPRVRVRFNKDDDLWYPEQSGGETESIFQLDPNAPKIDDLPIAAIHTENYNVQLMHSVVDTVRATAMGHKLIVEDLREDAGDADEAELA